jgi:hypothetical protein
MRSLKGFTLRVVFGLGLSASCLVFCSSLSRRGSCCAALHGGLSPLPALSALSAPSALKVAAVGSLRLASGRAFYLFMWPSAYSDLKIKFVIVVWAITQNSKRKDSMAASTGRTTPGASPRRSTVHLPRKNTYLRELRIWIQNPRC